MRKQFKQCLVVLTIFFSVELISPVVVEIEDAVKNSTGGSLITVSHHSDRMLELGEVYLTL